MMLTPESDSSTGGPVLGEMRTLYLHWRHSCGSTFQTCWIMLDRRTPRTRRNALRLEREMLDDFNRRVGFRTTTPAPLLPQNRSRSSPRHASCVGRASCWSTSRTNAPSESAYPEYAA